MERRAILRQVVTLAMTVLAGAACTTSPTASGPPGGPDIRHILLFVHNTGHISYSVPPRKNQCPFGRGAMGEQTPAWGCATGAVDDAVNMTTLKITICSPGYVQRVTPPTVEINTARKLVFEQYSLTADTHGRLDWLIPLSIGGASDISNLWPITDPRTAAAKDKVDNDILHAICSRKVKIVDAQLALVGDWTYAEHRLRIDQDH